MERNSTRRNVSHQHETERIRSEQHRWNGSERHETYRIGTAFDGSNETLQDGSDQTAQDGSNRNVTRLNRLTRYELEWILTVQDGIDWIGTARDGTDRIRTACDGTNRIGTDGIRTA